MPKYSVEYGGIDRGDYSHLLIFSVLTGANGKGAFMASTARTLSNLPLNESITLAMV